MKKLASILFSVTISAAAQNPCAQIEAAKTKIYDFHPSKVDKQTREAKSKEMDKFWKQVKAAGPAGVSCLRQLLTSEKDGFFLFDGASLGGNCRINRRRKECVPFTYRWRFSS